jgi:hypothetical protein
MTMTSKYAGTCITCKGRIEKGETINWVRGVGASHATADACARAKALAAPKATVTIAGDMAPVVAFLNRGKASGLKAPAVSFLAPRGGTLTISLAPDSGRNPGAIYVKVNGDYVGKISPDGSVGGALAGDTGLQAALIQVATDPATHAREYGKLSGRCSFCQTDLTDDRSGSSVEMGYGPVCAKRYNLPWKPAGKRHELKPLPMTQAQIDADEQAMNAMVAAQELDEAKQVAAFKFGGWINR